jgi:hypothetical protein
MRVIRTLVSLTIAAALAGPAMAQQKPKPKPGASRPVMYKCVDDRGKIYYSDKFTPECGQIEEMNRQGRVVKKHETAQPAVAPKPAAEEERARKELAERQRRDRALIATYTSEEEIDLARDRSLAITMQAIKAAENRLARANSQLFDLKSQANRFAGEEKAIPPYLLEEIDVKLEEIPELEAEFLEKKSYAESVRAKYDADKLRYRELKSAGK